MSVRTSSAEIAAQGCIEARSAVLTVLDVFVELRPGTSPEIATQVVYELSTGAKNVMAGLSLEHVKQFYLTWVEKAEGQLRNVFADPSVWDGLYSDIHWRIRNMSDEEPRPLRLIELEVRRQGEWLDGLLVQIDNVRTWVNRSGARCVVVDTNVLLHHVPPDQINWAEVVDSQDEVRLIVPLRVVNELDEKKYARDGKIGKRARSVLTQLGNALLSSDSVPSDIADGVSLEVAPFVEPRERPLDADWEILSCCLALAPYAPDLLLATGDTAMRIRGQQLDIDTREIPAKYLRSREEPS